MLRLFCWSPTFSGDRRDRSRVRRTALYTGNEPLPGICACHVDCRCSDPSEHIPIAYVPLPGAYKEDVWSSNQPGSPAQSQTETDSSTGVYIANRQGKYLSAYSSMSIQRGRRILTLSWHVGFGYPGPRPETGRDQEQPVRDNRLMLLPKSAGEKPQGHGAGQIAHK